jgi:hypothetical protein
VVDLRPNGVYARLGVRPVVNARGVNTMAGGSLMPPAVLDAMVEAAACFVDMGDLTVRAGARIAALTGPRQLIASFVAPRRDHFSAQEVWEELRSDHHGIGRSTVFRTLELLVELGALDRVLSGAAPTATPPARLGTIITWFAWTARRWRWQRPRRLRNRFTASPRRPASSC